jgi:hypothetical protein
MNLILSCHLLRSPITVLFIWRYRSKIVYAFIFSQCYTSEMVYWHESINMCRANWLNRKVLLQNQMITQLVEKFLDFYGTGRPINMFTRAHH